MREVMYFMAVLFCNYWNKLYALFVCFKMNITSAKQERWTTGVAEDSRAAVTWDRESRAGVWPFSQVYYGRAAEELKNLTRA